MTQQVTDPVYEAFLELRSYQAPDVQRQMDEDMADAQEYKNEFNLKRQPE